MVQDVTNGVLNGLTQFIGGLGSSLLDFITTIMGYMINIVIFPINALISLIFPNFTESVEIFSQGIIRFTTAPISYFSYHIPPMTKGVILLYLAIMLGYYSIIWTYRSIILIPIVIRKIKFW